MARMAAVSPYVLIAMTTDERGQGMRAVIDELGLRSEVFSDAEQLLYHTRGSVPDALVLEHGLAQRVAQLDLVALLRRRKGLEDVPFVYLGPDNAELQAQVVASGADVFLTLPTRPAVLKAYLEQRLYHTRGSVPDALVLEHGLAQRVAQLDLVALLRRRKGLEDVPFVYLGPDNAELQAQVVASGADVFLTLPTRPAVLKAYLE